MLKGTQHDPGATTGGIVIELPESVKKKLPRDFNIDEIGKIDLREAESIASEDILFINENEIIEGLEDFELIPEKTPGPAMPGDADDGDKSSIGDWGKVRERTFRDIPGPHAGTNELASDRDRKIPGSSPAEEARQGAGVQADSRAPGYGDDAKRGVIASREAIGDGGETPQQALDQEKTASREGYVERDDEYVIWDMPDEEIDSAGVSKKAGEEKQAAGHAAVDAREPMRETPADDVSGTQQDDDEVVISREELTERPGPLRETGGKKMAPAERPEADGAPSAGAAPAARRPLGPEAPDDGTGPIIHQGAARAPQGEAGTVVFVDDRTGAAEGDTTGVADDGELDRIISGIVRFDEGPAYVLGEADVEEDRERIAVLTDDLAQVDEELFVDLDYKYGDEELDYIHTAIAEEDYGDYIREIDEFFGTKGGRTVPARVELLGMTADEFDTIEDLLFKAEFKDIHLYDRYQMYEFDRGSMEERAKGSKSCRYLLPAENSIRDMERDSIESDISAGSALIFEEDVEEIRAQLKRRTGKSDAEIAAMFERAMNAERAAELPPPDAGQVAAVVDGSHEEMRGGQLEKETAPESMFDITDRVVILEDKADVERFISGFPEGKQMNIKMLLKYLDGLFEKLPEETIKKFASSDYFDLYLKVLNELGV